MDMVSNSSSIGAIFEEAVRNLTEGNNIAVAFSGGLDSGLVAALTKKYARSVTLYTVGYGESYDVRMAKQMSEDLGMDWEYIPITEDNIMENLREAISITGTTSPLTLSFEMPPFYVCKNCKEELVIGGQGSDEIFAGYSKYVGLKDTELIQMMYEDLDKLTTVVLAHETKVAEHFGKNILYPFLDQNLVTALKGSDIEELRPKDQEARKVLLKDIAAEMGYPFIADKKKKAAQYGSGTMDVIHKICKSKGMTYSELVADIYKNIFS